MKDIFSKEPNNLNAQIEALRGAGMIIEPEDVPKIQAMLKQISYYRLLNEYSPTLMRDGRYLDNICFDDVINVYNFESELRFLLFSVIEKVELALRAKINLLFGSKYGKYGHLDPANFQKQNAQKKLLDQIQRSISKKTLMPLVRMLREDQLIDGHAPIYTEIETISFGTLANFYKNMKTEDKKVVAADYGLHHHYYESYIDHLAHIRNLCAHYAPLYNSRNFRGPKLYTQYRNQQIANNSLAATFICLYYILDWEEFTSFYQKFEILLQKYPQINPNRMGFPADHSNLFVPRV